MGQQGWWLRLGVRCALAAALSSGAGCLSFCHSIDRKYTELAEPCLQLPRCCRDHVYVFLIHGMDPLDFANLGGVNRYLHDLGFNKTYYGQLYHTGQVIKEIRRVHAEDPEAHFVLIGFSFGANMVRNVAQAVNGDGVMIDLLVYLGGNTLEDIPRDKPENCMRIINILASGCIWNGAWMEGADNYHETNVWHFGSPTHPKTLEIFAQELTLVAAAVPASHPAPGKALPGQVVPPDGGTPSATYDGWDFLKPVPRLELATLPPTLRKSTATVAAKPVWPPPQQVAVENK